MLSSKHKSQINNLTLQGNKLKEQKTKPKARREVRAEINNIRDQKKKKKINKTISWFFEKINKMDKSLANEL